ncbi:uncharacterized protein LOC113232520 [Hyposmocoma kahamanoa]|uniref:uncharacterized protein LOC113232520 n=1 Tax=Hyposmocoma kahamanoa TaxID=1477025 RepID=UPI000E6D6E68|nr:uncharacterized protein LOC113232520 [Hyposmocoma kahamanoa]XP_026323063.1 uncharacterized protein LOC113232520 [Hyposmocoma kahamanoa]
MTPRISIFPFFVIVLAIQQITSTEDGYLQYVKDGCFTRGEALSCVKYKALKIAKKSIFGDDFYSNETIKANNIISFVPLDEDTIKRLIVNDTEVLIDMPRSIFSEWTQLAQYFMKLVKDFFKLKGLRVELPDGARTIEETDNDGRGRRKKLALIVPLLTLLAVFKTKVLLVPILLSVLLIKKLLLIAALLLPSLLSTLKHCKHRGYSYFGGSDSSDFSSDYNTYGYSTGYSKDWALNRAYNLAKHRPTPGPMYGTAPGAAV